jgi:4-hydroxybenzoate polyprenyltransferase
LNAIELFHIKAKLHPNKMAVADIRWGSWSFQEIINLSIKVQTTMEQHKIRSGDSVLLMIAPCPALYGIICGLLGMGVRIVFIEPWLKVDRINEVIKAAKPKAFISGKIGKVWGVRSQEIRKIPLWLTAGDFEKKDLTGTFSVEDLPPDHHAFVVFSSGTTGNPKGVLRTHQYLKTVVDIFISSAPEDFETPDLCIFPNLALFHLATGRGSIIIPNRWSRKNLQKLFEIARPFGPQTISTGPAFFKKLMDENLMGEIKSLKRIVFGGALTDCWLMEKVIEELPAARVLHLYGGSEAEPVAYMDAKEALKQSRAQGYFQTLCLGKPIKEIQYKFNAGVLWVSGPNVSGEYIGDASQNLGIKERDESGTLWHCMGDKINEKDGHFWYAGRLSQRDEDFILEQKVYAFLKSSKSFIHRDSEQKIVLIGDKLELLSDSIKKQFPQIHRIASTKIIRDHRHRSRIDRIKSLPRKYRTEKMSQLQKWQTYLQERSPLPALFFISTLGALSSLSFKNEFDPALFLAAILFNTLIFIQLRLGDEVKDFEKDKIVNPTRPLPRGLLTTSDLASAMNKILIFVILAGLTLGLLKSWPGGLVLSMASVFAWLMYKEFFVGEILNKEPIVYAITHQVIVFLIYGWVALATDSSLIYDRAFQGWLLANFGGSFTFEICRKLNPNAHKLAQTYAQHYGPGPTVFICTIFICIMAAGSFMAGFGVWTLLPLMTLEFMLIKWIKNPHGYKKIEAVATLAGLIVVVAPAIMWLIRTRS